MTTVIKTDSIHRSPSRLALLLIPVVFACFALPPTAQALLPPPAPDGGYLNGNTAEGDGALYNLTSGYGNTAEGDSALFSLTSGGSNTANGYFALSSNTTGNNNTANGAGALECNTTGNLNTANGNSALEYNTTGNDNTANGDEALKNNTTANNNTAVGLHGAFHNTTGANNTAIGHKALANNTIGSSNIALGKGAGVFLTTGSNNIDIGSAGVAGESNTIRIGSAQVRTFIKGISGAVVSGAAVVVNAGGQLGVTASSERFKDEIKPMDKASEVILALKPVTFRYKKDIDPDSIPQFGLVAEEVEKVNPALVTHDADGKVYTVRYEQVNAMLLNEFLKEHRRVERQERKIQEQETTIVQLKREMETVVTHAKEQDANIQRVSAQVEISKPAPRMAINP